MPSNLPVKGSKYKRSTGNMKARTELKSKGPRKVNSQQVVYELKHRVVLALNKIADRDTYHIGVEELEKAAEALNPDRIIPFLSCILDTDSEQKSAVRKECVRMMGELAKIHGGLIGPHVGKMVASIVKRLKDQDSVVRDTCVETMGVFASEFGNSQLESDGIFVLLVRPLFEALGEQNKQIQSGAAMCLARVIDNIIDPPTSILQKMLVRTMKLLKNPHFMAKPAVIELNKSLILAGGALSHSALSSGISSIQEALKDNDWTTRKAASLALGEIGASGGLCLVPFKASCIQALESCRFDKVKPVRDTVLQGLGCWRSILEDDEAQRSDSKSIMRGNLSGDNRSELVSACSSMWEDVTHKESIANIQKKSPGSSRDRSQKYAEGCKKSNNGDWHIDIAVPKTRSIIQQDLHNEGSENSCITRTVETVTANAISMEDIGHAYDQMDEKQEYSSASNHVSDNFTNHFMAASHCPPHRSDLKLIGGDQLFAEERSSSDRRSLESTVMEMEESQAVHASCSQTKNEMSSIRKQLAEIEKKQSGLMDLLQVFTTNTMESLAVIQLKVSSLEHAVDRILHVNGGRYTTDHASMRCVEKCQSFASPAISAASTPRPSTDMHERKSSTQPSLKKEVWKGKAVNMKSRSASVSPCLESQREPLSMMNRSLIGGQTQKNIRQDMQSMSYRESRKTDRVFTSIMNGNDRQNGKASENDTWKRVKGFLCEGELDSAYGEALCSRNQRVLIELIDATGPVLDSLSNRTICNHFSTLAACILEQGTFEPLIPWLQQIVDLSVIHGPSYIPLSLKVKREIISAVQDALDAEVTHPAKRRLIAQLAMKLQQIWGK